MQKIIVMINAIQHFLHSDHKAEILFAIITSTSVSSGISYVGADNHMDALYSELIIRDINTVIVGLATGLLTFYVTNKLKKKYQNPEK